MLLHLMLLQQVINRSALLRAF